MLSLQWALRHRAPSLARTSVRRHNFGRCMSSAAPPTPPTPPSAPQADLSVEAARHAKGTIDVVVPTPTRPVKIKYRPVRVEPPKTERPRDDDEPKTEEEDQPQAPPAADTWFTFVRRHLMTLGFSMLISTQLGVVFTWSNEASRLIGIDGEFDLYMEELFSEKSDLVEMVCDRLCRASSYNDETRRRIVKREDVANRLLDLITSGPTQDCRKNAARTMENIFMLAEVRAEAVQRGYHVRLQRLLDAPTTPKIVQKFIASALVQLLEEESNLAALASSGVIGSLHAIQQNDKLRRQRCDVVLQEACAALRRMAAESKFAMDSVPAADAALVEIYAGAHAATLADPINTIRSPLIKSGLMMYLHTVAGGAAWGLGSSLYHGTPVLSAVARTALVTGLVPAFFVGGIVSLFQRYQRDANTEHEVFRLYSATMFATVWPALYIMPAVDRYAPLWLGGHVVGFGSFFLYMLLTDADLMKNDHALEQEAPPPSPFEDMRARLRKARLEARVKRDLELEAEREEKAKEQARVARGSAPL